MPERVLAWYRVLGWSLCAACFAAPGLAAQLEPDRFHDPGALWFLPFLSFPVVGAVIVSMRPHQSVGWLLLGVGLAPTIGTLAYAAGHALFGTAPAAGALIYMLGPQLGGPALSTLLGLLLLLFPSGRLPSARWRWVVLALLGLAAAALVSEFTLAGPVADPSRGPSPDNPIRISAPPELSAFVFQQGPLISNLLLLICAGSLVVRYRRANLDDRQRIKWFALAAGIFTVLDVGDTVLVSMLPPTSPIWTAYHNAEFLAIIAVAAAIGVAILRHRLFDIDLVISRTLAYTALATLITGFYVLIVIGAGALLGAGSQARFVLSLGATAAVAVIFHPLRTRALRLADRLVFGQRDTPYDVLAGFSARLAATADWDSATHEMARVLAEGTGSIAASVWMLKDGDEVAVGTWPSNVAPVTLSTGIRSADIRHQGELLGRLTVDPGRRGTLTHTEQRLMNDLAQQAGFVLRTVGLQETLKESLEQLRASRQRLVTAQDGERRRLERDLHDGAQQNLTSLRMKLGLAQTATAPEPLRELLREMQEDVGEALETVRSLARGVHPPLLEAQGLMAALTARARSLTLPVEVRCEAGRYSHDVEAVIYFCCAEALQNLAKHARASRATLHVWRDNGRLEFEVCDNGDGFDPSGPGTGVGMQSMRDRVDALGGRLDVTTRPHLGTTVSGWLPLGAPPQ